LFTTTTVWHSADVNSYRGPSACWAVAAGTGYRLWRNSIMKLHPLITKWFLLF